MSSKIEYNTVIEEDGTIHIPANLRKELPEESVHVTVEPFDFPSGEDAIKYLLDHPIYIHNFKMPTWDEMHER
jgi:hypothetical protein